MYVCMWSSNSFSRRKFLLEFATRMSESGGWNEWTSISKMSITFHLVTLDNVSLMIQWTHFQNIQVLVVLCKFHFLFFQWPNSFHSLICKYHLLRKEEATYANRIILSFSVKCLQQALAQVSLEMSLSLQISRESSHLL